jgi:hypothetical protein
MFKLFVNLKLYVVPTNLIDFGKSKLIKTVIYLSIFGIQ